MKHIYLILLFSVFIVGNKSAASDQSARVLRSSGSALPIESQEKCIICRCDIDVLGLRKHTSLPCSHIFHTSCLRPWLQRGTCPICRAQFAEVPEGDDDIVLNPTNIPQVLLRIFFINIIEQRCVAIARTDEAFMQAMQELFPAEHDVFSGLKIADAHAVFLLVRDNRLNEAYRLSRFFNLSELTQYTMECGADPETPINGEPIILEIVDDEQAFVREWIFNGV